MDMSEQQMEAAAKVIGEYADADYKWGKRDCATLCQAYAAALGRAYAIPAGVPLTLRRCIGVMGKPHRRHDVGAGDIVLADGFLAIHMGYCLLTMHEDGGLTRMPLEERCVGWTVG